MLTTAGLTSCAMFRKVAASMGPLSGELLTVGVLKVLARDDGVRSSRDAMTMPTTSEAAAISVVLKNGRLLMSCGSVSSAGSYAAGLHRDPACVSTMLSRARWYLRF